ncbi:uncharacterized protein LOC110184920 [Drosophila serrata]|uniref:uncharacterized protein LOC110184920 n=1 Tax=Drosophila serrata TaxID=7274 RepID=UPI000A1D215A|nr:uncharacterized protein LOC110184920 [Drosophila serrata]
MSFTLTSQSVIRFESSSSRLRDEWQRTLMFFNVDISGGVHCDHRNEITQDRNGERRNPGGGLSNPIRECAMPFGKQNEFYAQSRDDFGPRALRSRRRSLVGRRRRRLSCGSRMRYRPTKPRWNNPDIAPFSHFPAQNSNHPYVTPDYDTDNGYNNHCAHNPYQSDEFELPNQNSRDLIYPETARDSRDCYGTDSYTDSSYESPRDYYDNERLKRGTYQRSYEPPPYRNCSPYYPDEHDDFNMNGRESLSQLNIFRRGKQRQTSGSMIPEYAINYNDKYHKERYVSPNDSDFEDRYEDSEATKVRYSPQKRFGYDDYGEKRHRPPPLPSPKPRAKFRSDYKPYKDKGYAINQSRHYKTDLPDMVSHHSHVPGNRHRNRSRESGSCHRNRSRRHSYLEKNTPYFTPYKKSREASAHNNRISRQTLSLGSPKMHQNMPKAHVTVPRRPPEKRKLNFEVEEIPQPFKKYIRKEVPPSNFTLASMMKYPVGREIY